jgi:hypothetical protein
LEDGRKIQLSHWEPVNKSLDNKEETTYRRAKERKSTEND